MTRADIACSVQSLSDVFRMAIQPEFQDSIVECFCSGIQDSAPMGCMARIEEPTQEASQGNNKVKNVANTSLFALRLEC